MVHGYKREREELLRIGVEIYEFKPDAAIRYQVMTGALQREMNFTPVFGLHAKSMVVDQEIAVIGTFNLDPRSANLNTECIAVIRDAMIAENLYRTMTGFCFGGSFGHGLSDKVAVYFRTDLTQNNIDNNFFYEYFRLVNLEGGLNLYFRIPDTKLYPYIDTSWGLRVLNLQKTGSSQQVAGIFSVGGGIDVVQGTAISIGCGLVYDWFNINYKASFGTYFADKNGIPPIDDQKITTHRIVLGIAFW